MADTTVKYVVRDGDAGVLVFFRQIFIDSSDTPVAETEATMFEVRQAAPEVLAQYFSMMANKLRATADYLDSVGSTPTDVTRNTIGAAYKETQTALMIFDNSLLPPELG
jgi:hypothetical protein